MRAEEQDKALDRFLFPRITWGFVLRIVLLGVGTWIVGTRYLRPMVVDGASMEPTYAERGFNFCVLTAFKTERPQRGQVVTLKYGGYKYMLLKRVLAFEGETVEFREGACYINGARLEEPYVRKSCDWTIPPRVVAQGNVYVMGDNRSVPFEQHVGGEIAVSRVAGRPLW